MDIRKFYKFVLLFLILFPLLVFISAAQAFPIMTSEETDGFGSFSHDLDQGFINQSSQDREIFYWMQVSDIHIDMSEKGDKNRENFEKFCGETIPTISPGFVISSGDNVNGPLGLPGRPKQHYQSEEEHKFFYDTLEKFGLNSSFYYTGVGNHETYNLGTDRTLYREYMREDTRYYFDVEAPGGKYRFVILDTTQNVGMGNPFDYWGEMKKDKLNEIETLIEETSEDIDEIIFVGHHPIHHIYSARSDSGKTFMELITESDTAMYLCGHTHTKNSYWNHGGFTELVCPQFRGESNYRILAIDNGLYSISEQVSGEWPAVIVTNPISNLFYHKDGDYKKMVESEEIRTLIFDPNPVKEAYVEIDGEKVGDLTNQTNNLWTLSYDPNDYDSGDHDLKVVVKSDSGEMSDTITFNLEDFSPVQVGGAIKFLIGIDLMTTLLILLALSFLSLYTFSVLPKLYYYSSEERRNRLSEIKVEDYEDENFIKRHYKKKWVQAAKLPISSWLALVLAPTYLFFGPIMIGPFVRLELGALWMYGGIAVGNTFFTLYSLIWATAFLLLFRIPQNFTIRSNQPNPSKWRYIPLMLFFLIWVAVVWFYSDYFTLLIMLLNPMVLISFGVSIFLLWTSKGLNTKEYQKN